MLDIKFIRNNPEVVRKAIQNKNIDLDLDKLLALDSRRRELIESSETVKAEQNKKSKGPQFNVEELKSLKEKFKVMEHELTCVEEEFSQLMLQVPNIPSDDTPIGRSETENIVVKKVGEPKKIDFQPKSHWELGQTLNLIDKERASKVAGSRFAYIKGGLVKLQFALLQFGVDNLTDQKVIRKIIKTNKLSVPDSPFDLVLPPALIKTDAYVATARLNGAEMTYKLENDDLWLNASAEHSIAPMYLNETLDESDLPIRYLGYTTAFRREAGTYGKDTEGILRMHQFDKLELESFSTKEQSLEEHIFFIAVQEYLMEQLKIPYHVLLKCTADIGFANARGVDIEAWMPGQNKYRETHSADYTTDFQARRLNTRVRRFNGELELAHTNDATAFALGRILIAIMENYQTSKGTIEVPKVLRKYMGGVKEIK